VRQFVFFATLLLSFASVAEAPGSRLHRDIPDYAQTAVRGAEFGNGQQFCAPAAVSNSLMWLGAPTENQHSLVTLLASTGYMNTDLKIGTGTSELLRGVDRYATEAFGGFRTLAYQGWRRHPAKYSENTKKPAFDFIARGVAGRSAAWLNVGWYRIDGATGSYRRIGGHWVTLVGYDFRKRELVVHDPAPRAGHGDSREFVSFRALAGGRLTGKISGLPTDASGYLQLGRGMHLHPKADTAIVDGVVLLEL